MLGAQRGRAAEARRLEREEHGEEQKEGYKNTLWNGGAMVGLKKEGFSLKAASSHC